MTVSMNLLGHPNVIVEVPCNPGMEPEPKDTMKYANRRYAAQGAERITLVPNRNGTGWEKKEYET